MKKTILAAGIFLAITAQQANAQEQGFHAGLNTGYYYTTILDKGVFDSPSYDHQTTFKAAPIGLTLGYQWEGGFGIQAEFINAKIGQKMDVLHIATAGGPYSVVGEKEINLTYWQLPLLFKLQKGSETTRFAFVLGPQVSFLSKGEDVESYSQSEVIYAGENAVDGIVPGKEYIIGSTEQTARYNFNTLAVGLVAGAGVDVFISDNVYLSGMIRAGYNFTEIREEEGGMKFADTPLNTVTATPPTETEDKLYKRELRSTAFGGLQIGIHYLFGQ